MGHFAVPAKAVLFLDLNAEQMSSFTPSLMWNNIINKWCKIKSDHNLMRAYDLTTWEEVMAEPIWFNPLIKLPGLRLGPETLDGTSRTRWDPIAQMQFHTLRDLWDDNLNGWADVEALKHWAPQFIRDTALTTRFFANLEKSLEVLINAIPKEWTEIAMRGPLPFKKGEFLCSLVNDTKYAVVQRAGENVSKVDMYFKSSEGFLYPATEGILVQNFTLGRALVTDSTKFGRMLGHGPIETTWPPPDLFILAHKHKDPLNAGTPVSAMASKGFYKLLLPDHTTKTNSKKPLEARNKWMDYLGISQELYLKASKIATKISLPLIPAEQQVYRKMLMTAHKTGSKQFWWNVEVAQCQHCPTTQPDNHFHVFWECTEFPMLVWSLLLQHLDPLLELSSNSKNTQRKTNGNDAALCLFALGVDGKPAPMWWILVQRITLRNIWNFYTDHKYGTGPSPRSESYPINTAKHSISEFKHRLCLEFEQAMKNFRTYEGYDTPKEIMEDFNHTWEPAAYIDFRPSITSNKPERHNNRRRRDSWKPATSGSVYSQIQLQKSHQPPFPDLFGIKDRHMPRTKTNSGNFALKFHPCLDTQNMSLY
jgi:hypothetical protein